MKEMEFISDTTGIITLKIKPNFKTLGKVYGARMKEIAGAFANLSQGEISRIRSCESAGEAFVLTLPGGDVTLNPGDYFISSEDMSGWLVASEGSLTIALDVALTDDLLAEGTARELINRIQNLRKESGFDVTDKIDVAIFVDGKAAEDISRSLAGYKDYIAAQTLARSVELKPLSEGADAAEVEWDDAVVKISVSR